MEEIEERRKELRSLSRMLLLAIVLVGIAVLNVGLLYRRMPTSDLVMQLLLAAGIGLLAGLIWYWTRVRKELRTL